jgi:peptidyl-dipeptidase Dcp
MSEHHWRRVGLPAALVIVPLLAVAVSTTTLGDAIEVTAASTALDPANPFAAPSSLPYQLPPFDRIHDGDFMPAFIAGMAEQLREVQAITSNPEPASFENTSLALEKTGRLLGRVGRTFNTLNASHGSEATQKIAADTAPLLAAHSDAINLDVALFKRIDALYQRRSSLGLDAESLALLERQHLDMVRAGAMLPEAAKAQLRQYNTEISTLASQFGQNLLKEAREGGVLIDRVTLLDGLSAAQVATAAEVAKAHGMPGQWMLPLQNTTTQPVLAQLKNRALRERIYKASVSRASSGATNNLPVLLQLSKLRAERAQLLGYASHAAYTLEDESAGTPAAVDAMLKQLAGPTCAAVLRETAAIRALIAQQTTKAHTRPFEPQAWDWDFYAEQVRKARYDFNEEEVKPYFELNRVLEDGVFYAAHELFGLTFKERKDLPVYGPDVGVYEVFDADGSALALFYTDYFARDYKNGGAWMSNFVEQSQLYGLRPIVINNVNIGKPAPGQPVLLSFDEVRTLFHEFGHALHGMLSNVNYESLAGTNTTRDFVEFPSQYNEMWAREPVVLAHYARHYQTGAPLPPALLQRILAAQNFNQGYATAEKITAAAIDMAFHQLTPQEVPAPDQVAAFEQHTMKSLGLDLAAVPPRYHAPYFRHVFADEYSAGYYAYLWSEVLARDTGQWLHEHGGLTRANGQVLRDKLLSRGRTRSPQQLFLDFYGRAPDAGPLVEYHGLKASAAPRAHAAPRSGQH